MANITQNTIEKVAHLARLKINDDESDATTQDIKNVINLIEKINTVDVDSLQPLANPLGNYLTARQDIITEENQREKLLALAPSTEAGLYLVPKVIE